ncbi:PhzF family phenazine biosynthesis protein [Candidatus Soleaferrea massiliensis]|uniref:PhzF family phenazine biosynthesis protein n=1 Tax=Candidatus Soleaferrea massiliensis TaxID=1470354 RepID=UPI00058E632A|nr:PhzF family phenazine biosynthesis protein [Candidatus Soleaferrea massiliensis]
MRYYVVDAFADRMFHGNPAGVCLADRKLDGRTMQRIAAQNNLAETAFLSEKDGAYHLRWFTPEEEIDLCGHATLAAAFVLMNEVRPALGDVVFETMSGPLRVVRGGELYTMDFPSRKPVPAGKPARLEEALGCRVLETHQSRDLLALVGSQQEVCQLRPNMEMLRKLDGKPTIIVTAKGEDCDFVSRFFIPHAGITEDPVTGSAHSTLIPFWSERLGKKEMLARQLSARGGTLFCKLCGDRVKIAGAAVLYLSGEIML